MKHTLLFIATLVTISSVHAQNPIPNADFTTYWDASPGQPNGWTDCQDITQVAPGNGVTGNAAQGHKLTSPFVTYPAFRTSSAGVGIPITVAYTSLNLYYRFESVNGDVMKVTVSIFDASDSQIGFGIAEVTSTTGSVTGFVPLTVPINYSGTGAAEVIISVIMNTSSGGAVPNHNSNFAIDDLLLSGGTVSVDGIEKEAPSLRIFPNPATTFTRIETSGADSKVNAVQVMDMNGRVVKEISGADASVNLLPLADLPCGTYTVAVNTGEVVQTKRLVIE